MPTVTPTLTLPQPTLSSALSSRPAAPAPAASAPAAGVATPAAAPAPSATFSFSPQAMAAAGHPALPAPSSPPAAAPPAPVAVPHDGSVYEALKSGITTAVVDVGDAIAGGAHAVVDGVESALSTANKVVKGTLELPFAAVSKACDAVGAVIDEL